jgi:hypothetical protein
VAEDKKSSLRKRFKDAFDKVTSIPDELEGYNAERLGMSREELRAKLDSLPEVMPVSIGIQRPRAGGGKGVMPTRAKGPSTGSVVGGRPSSGATTGQKASPAPKEPSPTDVSAKSRSEDLKQKLRAEGIDAEKEWPRTFNNQIEPDAFAKQEQMDKVAFPKGLKKPEYAPTNTPPDKTVDKDAMKRAMRNKLSAEDEAFTKSLESESAFFNQPKQTQSSNFDYGTKYLKSPETPPVKIRKAGDYDRYGVKLPKEEIAAARAEHEAYVKAMDESEAGQQRIAKQKALEEEKAAIAKRKANLKAVWDKYGK